MGEGLLQVVQTMSSINDFYDLYRLLMNNETDWTQYGYVYVKKYDDLTIFNYMSTAQYNDRWNWFETVSRGLIMNNVTGEIVARSFDKFFNWGERGRKGVGYMLNITKKMDGSLGILYRTNGEIRIATRASLDGPQAEWATRYLNKHFHEHLGDIPDELTLLFEIIYKENRIVIDYGNTEGLVLLAARNRHTGEYLPFFPDLYELALKVGFNLVGTVEFNSLVDVIAATGKIEADQEGWVVEMSDGSRWKFKGDAYREVHKALSGFTYKNMIKAVEGELVDEILLDIPEHILKMPEYLHEELIAMRDKVVERYADVHGEVGYAFSEIDPDMMTRKEFAKWVMTEHKDLSMYLFALYDDKNIDKLIFKHAFKDWNDE